MDFNDIIIFGQKSYAELLQDIYTKSNKKSKKIDEFLDQLKTLIQSSNDAAILIPLVKEYLDVSVKNDEQLVKMAAVIQRFFTNVASDIDSGMVISAEEKKQLLDNVKAAGELEDKKDVEISKLVQKTNGKLKELNVHNDELLIDEEDEDASN